ncbi:MAG: folate family ECF transporter S component [Clostridiales Family XIII bacterium]|jgi:ECF transporter S component (folate family)|nr:folate family ECF transporter S component [Clostridiales Family XIII bacterium]
MREFFSTKGVFTPKNLALLAILLAVRVILNLPFLTIYLTPSFKLVTFAYAADAIVAWMLGPVAAVAFAFAGDLLGFFASSGAGGAYFPGFALSEMVTCFLFALFFYRRAVTWPRAVAAWLLNLAVVLLGMNSMWLILMYGMTAGQTFTFVRVVSNLAQSPLHIVILYFLLTRLGKLRERL